jgi:hypothetical protein
MEHHILVKGRMYHVQLYMVSLALNEDVVHMATSEQNCPRGWGMHRTQHRQY